MAIGLGKMMGFKFPENFNSPYVSRSISEFWRRWHITLGDFMRDYLYIPLGGNRVKSKYRLYFNLWIVFILSGLWHGASWNYVIWGAYHGVFLILDRLFLQKGLDKIGKFPSILVTFVFVMIGWVIFKIEDFSLLKIYLSKLFQPLQSFEFNTIPEFNLVVCFAVLFAFITSLKSGRKIGKFMFEKDNYKFKSHVLLSLMSLILFTVSLSSITSSGFNPFIYFRF
jgi:alginate O-acetyltransferase complex protein AlgI